MAGGTAANGQGIAGVGWNVPLVGIRPLRPRDDGQTRTVAAAQTLARKSASVAVYDDTLIDQFALANALKVPVVNMGFGAQLFARRNVIAADRNGTEHGISTVLAAHPALIAGLADNNTLGVASAGRGKYGIGTAGASGAIQKF